MEQSELFAAVGCPWCYQGQSEHAKRDRLLLNAKINAATLLPQPLTPTGEGASCYSNEEHVNFVMLEVLPGRTQPISLLLEITDPLTLLCVGDAFPNCLQQISKEEVHGKCAQVCSRVKEAFPMQTCPYTQFCSPVLMLSFYDDNIY